MEKTLQMFDDRIIKKKLIEFKHSGKNADVGQFWRYREGINLGKEISKDVEFKRVCFVIHKHFGNGLFLVAPITTKYHHWMVDYYIKINNHKKYGLKECRIIINQIKLIDPRRLSLITGEYKNHTSLAQIVLNKYINLLTTI